MSNLPPDLLDLADSPDQRAAFADVARALSTTAELPPAFNDRLHTRLNAPLPTPRPGRLPSRLSRFLALAAMLLIGFFLGAIAFSGRTLDPLGPSVAWGDVVQAVNRVSHFHILAYQETHGDGVPPISRLDLFYQSRPPGAGVWRAQGLDHVQFFTPGAAAATRIWSIPDRAWKKDNVHLIPEGLTGKVESGNLLDVVLASLFHGTLPAAQPVKNDTLTTAAGIDVFDYVTDPSSQWARIWVTRDSRLPLRMNVYQPQYDGFLLVEFDYSEPQPADFFSPDAFEQTLHTLDPDTATRPARVFSVGAAPVDNLKPKTASQIHTVQPTARMPRVLSATRIPTGEILLVTTSPANFNEGGFNDSFEFSTVIDNRGTRYAAGWFSEAPRVNEDTPRVTWLLPVTTPAADADSVTLHVLTRSGDGKDIGILTARVTPGPAPDPKSILNSAPSAAVRFRELNNYWQQGTLTERLDFLDRSLAADPHSADILREKFFLLLEHDRVAEAWDFYEQQLAPHALDTLLDDPRNATPFAQYLIHLAVTGRQPEADALIAKTAAFLHDAAAGKRAVHQQLAAQLLRNEDWNLLAQLLALPDLRAWTASDNKPKLTRVVLAEDHNVIVQLTLPTNLPAAIRPDMFSSDPLEYRLWWGITTADLASDGRPLWTFTGRAYDPATRTLSLAFHGAAPQLTLVDQLALVRDNHSPSAGSNILYRWTLPVTLPAPSTPNGSAWWAANIPHGPTSNWFPPPALPSPFDATDIAAHEALRAGRNTEAAELFANLLHTLDTNGPPPNTSPEDLAIRRDDFHAGRIRALVALGELPAAQASLNELRATLPSPPDFHTRTDVDRYRTAINAAAWVADALTAAGQPDAARALLDDLEKVRPDLKGIPDTLVRENRPINGTWWYIYENKSLWRPLDRARWTLLDRQKTP